MINIRNTYLSRISTFNVSQPRAVPHSISVAKWIFVATLSIFTITTWSPMDYCFLLSCPVLIDIKTHRFALLFFPINNQNRPFEILGVFLFLIYVQNDFCSKWSASNNLSSKPLGYLYKSFDLSNLASVLWIIRWWFGQMTIMFLLMSRPPLLKEWIWWVSANGSLYFFQKASPHTWHLWS